MKKFKNIAEFESALKKQLEQHSVQPPAHLFDKLNLGVKPQNIAHGNKFIKLITNPLTVIKMAILAASIISVVYFATRTDTQIHEVNKEKILVDTLVEDIKIIPISPSYDIDQSKDEPDLDKNTPNLKTNRSEETAKSLLENTIQNHSIIEEEKPPTNNLFNSNQAKLTVSNISPCIGETVTLQANMTGDWLINNILIDTNKKEISLTPESNKPIHVKFHNKQEVISQTIQPSITSTSIITQKLDNFNYQFKLNDTNIQANWFADNELIASRSSDVTFSTRTVGEHTIKAVPLQSCATEQNITIRVKGKGSIAFFNVFTPNGDGTNDEYTVDIKHYTLFDIQIFNQLNNQLIFTSSNPEIKWNGQINNDGQECSPGEYVAKVKYQLEGEKPEIKNIKFTLLRP